MGEDYQTVSLLKENSELLTTVSQLEIRIIELEKDKVIMTRKLVMNEENEKTIVTLKQKLDEMTSNRDNLAKEMDNVKIDYDEKMDELRDTAEKNNKKMKQELDNINFKFDNVRKYETYIKTLERLNMELSEKLDNLEQEYEKNLRKAKENYNLRNDFIRKNAIDSLFLARKNIQEKTVQKNSNTHKLHLIQIRELSNELVRHAEIIASLQRKIENKDKIIFALRAENEIYKEVHVNLQNHNSKLAKIKSIPQIPVKEERKIVQEKEDFKRSSSTFYKTHLKEAVKNHNKGLKRMKWYIELVEDFLPFLEKVRAMEEVKPEKKDIENCLRLVKALNLRLVKEINLDKSSSKLSLFKTRTKSVDFNVLSKFEEKMQKTSRAYFKVNKKEINKILND